MAQLIQDGQLSFEGGQDSSLPPSRLNENQFAAGINVSTTRGTIRPRYAFERKTLSFPSGGYVYKFNKVAIFKDIFRAGRFQAVAPYHCRGRSYLVVVVSGVIFLVDVETKNVKVLTLDKDTQLSEFHSRVNWSVAGKYLVLHDFPSRPVIIDGVSARRSSSAKHELPPCSLSIYNQSRLFFANAGNEFTAGDPVGNPLTPEAPISVEEIEDSGSPYFAEVYQATTKYDSPVTALANLQATDKITGIGQLVVASRDEIFAFDTVKPRSEWLTGQFGSSLSDNAGIIGPRAFVNVASDLFFVSADGQMRSLSVAQAEQKKWARIPMNAEVGNWVSYLSDDLIPYTTVQYFRNKIFWSVRPYRVRAQRLDGKPILDVAHSGFVVLETDNLSRMTSDTPPAWAGLWTGLRPMDMCVIDGRMFVMSKDYYNRNHLYEVDPELRYDRTDTGLKRQIRGTIYTRDHFFQDMFSLKSLKNVEVGVENISGDFEVSIDWKPSHSADYLYWSTYRHTVPVGYQELSRDGNIQERTPLAFRELKFGLPDIATGHPVTKDLYERAKSVQYKISLQGDTWQLNRYRIQADVVPESISEFLPDDLPVVGESKQSPTDWQYEEFLP